MHSNSCSPQTQVNQYTSPSSQGLIQGNGHVIKMSLGKLARYSGTQMLSPALDTVYRYFQACVCSPVKFNLIKPVNFLPFNPVQILLFELNTFCLRTCPQSRVLLSDQSTLTFTLFNKQGYLSQLCNCLIGFFLSVYIQVMNTWHYQQAIEEDNIVY